MATTNDGITTEHLKKKKSKLLVIKNKWMQTKKHTVVWQ